MSGSGERATPSGIRGAQLDHFAIALARLADAPPLLVGELGGRAGSGGPGGGYRWADWEYAGGGRLEALEPEGPPGGFLHRFLQRQGPGIHHATFRVQDLDDAARAAREFGYDVVGYNDSTPAWKEAFLHPKQALGIVVQLAETNPEMSEEGLDRSFRFPPSPEPAGEPVRVVGLRMQVRTAERARRQWEALLGGSCESIDGRLCFRWPPSPMRIAVELDPDAEEGPVGIEIASEGALALSQETHPLLGVRILGVERASLSAG